MQIINDIKLDFNDVMLRPMTSTLNSRSEVKLERTFSFYHSPKKWTGVPIIAANMDTVGTLEMALELQKHKMITALHKFITVEEIAVSTLGANKNLKGKINPKYIAFSTGIRPADFDRLKEFSTKKKYLKAFDDFALSDVVDIIMVDVPNGYIPDFFKGCQKIRQMFPEHIIMAGNIVTADIAEMLIQHAGVDVVKVGIGPGEACTTRALTGVGYPQLSAVMETANAAHGLQGHIISDGGCRTPGDVAKAFGAGADFVMLGGMLAGHDESGGEIVYEEYYEKQGTGYADTGVPNGEFNAWAEKTVDVLKRRPIKVKFYGMSSAEAMEKHYGGVASHRAPEGKTILKDYKGPVEKTVLEILGGVRSSATYIGAKTIKEMHKRATFVRIK
jgi:GMP reductase